MCNHRPILFASLLLALTPMSVVAENMFCGSSLIRPGDTKPTVLEKCGEPLLTEVVSGADERKVEQWFYRTGPRRFQRVLTFHGLSLDSIETVTD